MSGGSGEVEVAAVRHRSPGLDPALEASRFPPTESMFQRAYFWLRRQTSELLRKSYVPLPRSSSTSLAVFRRGELRSLRGWRVWNSLLTLDRYKVFPLEMELKDLERKHA